MKTTSLFCSFLLFIQLWTNVECTRFIYVTNNATITEGDFDNINIIYDMYKEQLRVAYQEVKRLTRELALKRIEIRTLYNVGLMSEVTAHKKYADHFFDYVEKMFETIGLSLSIHDRDYNDVLFY